MRRFNSAAFSNKPATLGSFGRLEASRDTDGAGAALSHGAGTAFATNGALVNSPGTAEPGAPLAVDEFDQLALGLLGQLQHGRSHNRRRHPRF